VPVRKLLSLWEELGEGKITLISFTPTPALPQREREYRSFRIGNSYGLIVPTAQT